MNIKALSFTLLIIVLSMAMLACSDSGKTAKDSGSASDKKTSGTFEIAPPVGPPTYAPGMVGVQAKITSVEENGGEIYFDAEITAILGSGAAAKKPQLGQKMSLTYPNSEKTAKSASLIKDGSTLKMTLSNTPSITEGGEQWFCEKIHLEN